MQKTRIIHPLMGLNPALCQQTLLINDLLTITHQKTINNHAFTYIIGAHSHPLITVCFVTVGIPPDDRGEGNLELC